MVQGINKRLIIYGWNNINMVLSGAEIDFFEVVEENKTRKWMLVLAIKL